MPMLTTARATAASVQGLISRVIRRESAVSSAAGLDVLRAMRLPQHRLRCREPRQRDAIGRAADVVEPDQVAELDRTGLAAVLAADAELQVRLRPPPPLDSGPHQVTDALLVEHLERVPLEHAVLEVEGEELPLRVVARHAEGRLREVVGAEGEEVGDLRDLVRAQ